MSAGNRTIWFNKTHPMATFLDIRPEVEPTYISDSRDLFAFFDNTFDLIVFDPPHANFSKDSNFSKVYGHHTAREIKDIIKRSGDEAHRVSKPNAFMAFKWNDHDTKLESVLKLMPKWEPLFGHACSYRSKHKSQTCWVMLRRI